MHALAAQPRNAGPEPRTPPNSGMMSAELMMSLERSRHGRGLLISNLPQYHSKIIDCRGDHSFQSCIGSRRAAICHYSIDRF
jgi:hypothetical protein